jgi:hypothetical protein
MTGGYATQGYQTRIGTVLSDANSSGADFMKTLTKYQDYPGNAPWATASMPPNQDSYLQTVMSVLDNTRLHYIDYASVTLGPPGNNATSQPHVPSSALKYIPAGAIEGSPSTTTTTAPDPLQSCTSASGGDGSAQSRIVAKALQYAWEDMSHGLEVKPDSNYLEDVKTYAGGGAFGGADCGTFVGTVIHAVGLDNDPKTGFPNLGTYDQEPHMEHSDLWEEIPNIGNTSNLQPGDVFVVNAAGGGQGADGHIFIYVGTQPNGRNIAQASMKQYMPGLGNVKFSDNRGQYHIFRYKGGGGTQP